MSDTRLRSLEELRNNAEGLIYTTEMACKEHGLPMSADLEAAIRALQVAMSGDDRDSLEAALRELEGAAFQSMEAAFSSTRWSRSSKASSPRKAPPGFAYCGGCGGSGICVACDGNGVLAGSRCDVCEGKLGCSICAGNGLIRVEAPKAG